MSSDNDLGNIAFDLPKHQSNVIKVIGIGGGGSNAINHMFQQGIKGVDFVICNTDAQALQNSGVPNKIQLGVNLTEGLGAGANPDIGEQAAVESLEDIRTMLDTNTKMVFITAGMGGGTGTGAAPVIAKMAKEMDILTVGIVTVPFQFEGKLRNDQAQKGVENLRGHVDSLIVINNNKLRDVYGNLGYKAGFSKADEVLATASRGIAEVITHHYTQNIDLRDAKTVLSNSGSAIMGSATASGNSRAKDAIVKALDSPLLNDNKINGAKNVLLLIVSGMHEITIDEIGEINDYIQTEAGNNANIIMGVGEDESLDESIAVTVIATGFDVDQQYEITNTEAKKVVHDLEETPKTQETIKATEVPSIPEAEVAEPEIVKPTVEVKPIEAVDEQQEPAKVVHVLDIDEMDVADEVVVTPQAKPVSEAPTMDLIPTTELIKNINVVYEEVVDTTSQVDIDIEEDITITTLNSSENESAPSANPVVHEEHNTLEEDQQIAFTFELSVDQNQDQTSSVSEPVVHNLEDAKAIEVNDYIEVIPVTQSDASGEQTVAYDESDDIQLNSQADDSAAQKEITERPIVDPIHTPIKDSMQNRNEDRVNRLKDFNYKFQKQVDDLEKEPAYKRMGLELDQTTHSSDVNVSRLSVGTDDNDDIQLRDNNSFLHDNVD
ncbi:MAG: cell division protein FtsZ [Flavobacteriaceae bacterium]